MPKLDPLPVTVTCAPCCWGVDDVRNPHLPPWERVLDEAALQRIIGRRSVVLQRTTTAGAKIGTERIGAILERLKHPAL